MYQEKGGRRMEILLILLTMAASIAAFVTINIITFNKIFEAKEDEFLEQSKTDKTRKRR